MSSAAKLITLIPAFCVKLAIHIKTNLPWLHRALILTHGSVKQLLCLMILKMCTRVNDYQDAYRKDGFKGLIKAIFTSIPEILCDLLGDPRAVIAFVGRLLTRKEITEMFSKHSGLALTIGSFASRLA